MTGGLILGSLWALWHLPGFLIPSQDLTDIPPRGTVLDFVVFALALMALRLIMQWVFNNTRGSVLVAVLVHASWNTFYSAALVQLFPAPSVLGSYSNLTIGGGVGTGARRLDARPPGLPILPAGRTRSGYSPNMRMKEDVIKAAAAKANQFVPPGQETK